MNSLGERIRLARMENGYTQTKLATLMKVANVTVNRWEKNKTVPSSEDLIKLTKVLNTDFTSEEETATQSSNNSTIEMQLEELRLELANAKEVKKKMIIIMIIAIVFVIAVMLLAFGVFWINSQRFDPNKDDYPIKIVEYFYEEEVE